MMKNKVLSLYDWFLIIGVIASNIIYSVLSGNVDIVGSVAGIAGVLCVVLVAKGSIWNYLFGIINVSMYAYISYKASLYGDAALNALYYVPMQFIGWWQCARGERLCPRQRQEAEECRSRHADSQTVSVCFLRWDVRLQWWHADMSSDTSEILSLSRIRLQRCSA
jgi:nicotinamide riboside transporter PnuC